MVIITTLAVAPALLLFLSSSNGGNGMVNAFTTSTNDRMSHPLLTEQAHAYYKQYLTSLGYDPWTIMNRWNTSSHACANITAAPQWLSPRDLSEHDYLVEWWFYLGLLTDSKTNQTFGMDFTVWRFATTVMYMPL
jgi:hypothetical protein